MVLFGSSSLYLYFTLTYHNKTYLAYVELHYLSLMDKKVIFANLLYTALISLGLIFTL